jgi:branched-chain amino acid transport system permease protein
MIAVPGPVRRYRRWLKPATGVLAVAGLVAIGLVADRYTVATLSRILVVGLLAASVALLAGWCGLPSLGQTAPFAVGAYATGLLAKHVQLPGPALLLAAAVLGACFAGLTGPLLLRTRGTVFLMVSLAVGELVATAATRWTSLTGGSDGLTAIPATRPWPGGEPRHIYLYVCAVALLVVVAIVVVVRSPAGMLLRGTRDNEARLRAAGHPTGRYLYLAYVGAGAVAAIGGSLLVTVQRYVSPADVGFDLAALVLLAVVIGGTDSLVGAFAGAALIVATRDWLAGPWPGHAPLLVGGLLIAAVYLLPHGVAGLRRGWRTT